MKYVGKLRLFEQLLFATIIVIVIVQSRQITHIDNTSNSTITLYLNNNKIIISFFWNRMSQDITNSVWFEEENDLIKSCGALQSALGLSKSFSTSDIADATSMDTGCWLADIEDIRMPHSASELAINKLRINSDVLLMATNMQGRLGNTSRSLSTCVVVGDMASTSQLPSPSRYSSSLHNSYASPAFSPTDLVRSVNKKV